MVQEFSVSVQNDCFQPQILDHRHHQILTRTECNASVRMTIPSQERAAYSKKSLGGPQHMRASHLVPHWLHIHPQSPDVRRSLKVSQEPPGWGPRSRLYFEHQGEVLP